MEALLDDSEDRGGDSRQCSITDFAKTSIATNRSTV
jgi:hypothetical protein